MVGPREIRVEKGIAVEKNPPGLAHVVVLAIGAGYVLRAVVFTAGHGFVMQQLCKGRPHVP